MLKVGERQRISPACGLKPPESERRDPNSERNRRPYAAELRRALGEISRLDALCEERRSQLRSDEPTSEERAAQLREKLKGRVHTPSEILIREDRDSR